MFPALISAFSSVVAMFNPAYNMALSMSIVLGLRPLFADMLVPMLISLGVLAAFVPLSLFAAKGKFYCFWIAVGLYVLDFGYTFFLFADFPLVTKILSISMHAVFLGAYALGAVYYFRADRLLKANPKAILGK